MTSIKIPEAFIKLIKKPLCDVPLLIFFLNMWMTQPTMPKGSNKLRGKEKHLPHLLSMDLRLFVKTFYCQKCSLTNYNMMN